MAVASIDKYAFTRTYWELDPLCDVMGEGVLSQRSLAYPLGRLVAKSKHELGWRHQSDDCPPIRPPHGWDAPDAGPVPVFDEGVDRRRKPALVPCGFHVSSRDAEVFSDWDDDPAFRDIGVFGEKRARNVVAKSAGFAVAFLGAHELSSLKRKT